MDQQYFTHSLYYTDLVDEFPIVANTLSEIYYYNTDLYMDQPKTQNTSMAYSFVPQFEHSSNCTEEHAKEQCVNVTNPVASNHHFETDINLDLENCQNQGVQDEDQLTIANVFVYQQSYRNNVAHFDETFNYPIGTSCSAQDIYLHNQSAFKNDETNMEGKKSNKSKQTPKSKSTENARIAKTPRSKSATVNDGIKIICANCKTDKPRQWRNLDGEKMCNACWLYRNSHHCNRPFELYNKESKDRKPKNLKN
uniref:GATA-type domain-containing protein n=1 Tax=Rhabditophanes sp. KR3021 TaxID=114890 RepID=A0AC35TK27_9BILA